MFDKFKDEIDRFLYDDTLRACWLDVILVGLGVALACLLHWVST